MDSSVGEYFARVRQGSATILFLVFTDVRVSSTSVCPQEWIAGIR